METIREAEELGIGWLGSGLRRIPAGPTDYRKIDPLWKAVAAFTFSRPQWRSEAGRQGGREGSMRVY